MEIIKNGKVFTKNFTFEKADIKVTAISNDPSDEDNLTIRVNGRVITSGTWNNIFEPIEYGDNIFTIELSNAQENTSEHRSMYSYVRLSIDRCTSYVRLSIESMYTTYV